MKQMKITAAQNRIFSVELKVFDGDEVYRLQGGERFVFGVKKHPSDTEYIISKELTASDYDSESEAYTLTLSYLDTNIDAGIYCYDIALRYSGGGLLPVIWCNEFIVADSVVRSA